MLLRTIIADLKTTLIQGDLHQHITSIAYDSREVKQGSLFVAISGFTVDGHHFIEQAINNGATAILLENSQPITDTVTVLQVTDARAALAHVAANFYEHPADHFNLIGITGTNGKTSTTYFLKAIFDAAQQSTAMIGTIGTVINNQTYENKNTTPESLNLQHFFNLMKETQTENCIMEVSSHALDLHRVAHTHFKVGIFTNLSPDHLELHKNMTDYFQAKAKLFKQTTDYNIINSDDPYGQQLITLLRGAQAQTITYGVHEQADIYPSEIDYQFDQTTYTVNTPTGKIKVTVHLPGEIYVYNSLAAIACAYANDIPLDVIQQGLATLTSIKGRFEVVYQQDDFKVIIDFAHTEDALEKTLQTIRPYVTGRLILVFGVYADMSRDGANKRAGMGRVAAQYTDYAIVTSDNPKNNDQALIIEEISGAMDRHAGRYEAVLDRQLAIERAVQLSSREDVIVITGKGHETSQVIGDVSIPFNEKQIVLDALANKLF